MKNLKIFPCIHITFNRYKVWNRKALPPFTAESLTTNFNLLTADFLLLTGAHLICWKFEIFADCWLHLLTTDFKSLTANFKLLTSSNLCCNRKRPTTGTGVRINRVYFSYLNNDGNASFCFWDTKSDAFYIHTIGGTLYMIKKCEIDNDAWKVIAIYFFILLPLCTGIIVKMLTSTC